MPTKTKTKTERRDLEQEVTDRVLAALEEGTVPWARPWVAQAGIDHQNACTGTVYRGVNPFLLEMTCWAKGYEDPRWLTFKGAQGMGGSVRKGEKGTGIILWKPVRKSAEQGQPGARWDDQAQAWVVLTFFMRHYVVFNAAQVDGLELPPLPGAGDLPNAAERIERAEALMAGYAPPRGPRVGWGGSQAYYSPAEDRVQLPEREAFISTERYYGTAFHELVHSTGHPSRLDRGDDEGAFGSAEYAREELTAELGAAMLTAHAGLEPDLDQSAAYVQSWLRALRNDKSLVLKAAGRAQRAVDLVLGQA